MGSDAPLSFDVSIDAIKSALPANLQSPRVGIICGSGLSGLVNVFRDVVLVPYENIPGFSKSTGRAVGFLKGVNRDSQMVRKYPGIRALWRLGF